MTETKPPSPVRTTLAILLLRRVPFWQRSWPRRLGRYVALAAYLYLAAMLVLVLLEDRLLFPGATFARPTGKPPEHLRYREVTLTAADGERIHAWFSAPAHWEPEHGAVLYSHGNGGNLSRVGVRAVRWREPFGRAVMCYDYPGYGYSSGRPSEAGCYTAGEAAVAWLRDEKGVPPQRLILVGESMGGAIATELATRHEVQLLVLQGAFTSVPDMAQRRFPIFPGRLLARNQMDNEAKIGRVGCPVLIMHGTADNVVPDAHGERLYAAAREPKRLIRLEGRGHAPPGVEQYADEVRAMLGQTVR